MDLSRREVLGSSLALMAAQVATTAAERIEAPAAGLADDKSGDERHLWRGPHRFGDHSRSCPLPVGHSLRRSVACRGARGEARGARLDRVCPRRQHPPDRQRAARDVRGPRLRPGCHSAGAGRTQAQPAGCPGGERSDGARARLRRHAPRWRDPSYQYRYPSGVASRSASGASRPAATSSSPWLRRSKRAFGWGRPPRVTTSAAGI